MVGGDIGENLFQTSALIMRRSRLGNTPQNPTCLDDSQWTKEVLEPGILYDVRATKIK
jgi:hypothetical protein